MKTEQELKAIFGKNVFKQRDQKKWTQEELAEKAKVSKNTISDIEGGQKFARAKTLVKLALAFDTQVYELLKPDDVLPDKPTDIIAKYGEEVREKVAEIGSSYMEKMKQ
jgi:transcriptional regulator with XRE-family HTH domain